MADAIDPSDPHAPLMPRSADLTCVGAREAPTPGPTGTRSLGVGDWRRGSPIVGLCMRAYAGAIDPADTCRDSDVRTDTMGLVVLSAPATGPIGVRLFAQRGLGALDSYPDTTYFGLTEDHGAVAGVSDAVINEMALHIGLGARDPAAAVVGAVVVDCAGHPVYGGEVRLVRADGSELPHDGTGARRIYTEGHSRFDASQPWTHVDGVVGFVDVPVAAAGESVYVELFGRRSTDPAPVLLGCAPVQLVAGGTSLVLGLPLLPSGVSPCPVPR